MFISTISTLASNALILYPLITMSELPNSSGSNLSLSDFLKLILSRVILSISSKVVPVTLAPNLAPLSLTEYPRERPIFLKSSR